MDIKEIAALLSISDQIQGFINELLLIEPCHKLGMKEP